MKKKQVIIQLTEEDLQKIREVAARKGISHNQYIAMVAVESLGKHDEGEN